MKKKAAIVVLGCLALLILQTTAFAADPGWVKAKWATVKLCREVSPRTYACGTGVVVSSKPLLIATSNHFVGETGISVNGVAYSDWFAVCNPEKDIAVIYVKGLKGFPAVPLASSPVKVGDYKYVFGYPGAGGQVSVLSKTTYSSGGAIVAEVVGEDRITLGASGSPLFHLTKWELEGIVTGTYGNGKFLACPVQHLIPLMAEAKRLARTF